MAVFKYEVMQGDGKKRKGTIEATNRDAAAEELKKGGDYVLTLVDAGALGKEVNISIGKKVKPKELAVFCKQFRSIMAAGVTIIEALQMLAEQTENKTFRAAIEDVHDRVQRGETLAGAMSNHPKIFPEMMIQMMNAGEASGSLEIAFERLSVQFEKDAHLKAVIAKSMVYPIILICVIIGVVAIMMIKIVPSFTSTFDELGADLPAITKIVMGVSDFMVNTWYIFIIVIAVVVFLAKEFKKTPAGALFFGKLMLHLPLFGNLTVKSASAQFTRTLSTMLASGITLVDAIEIISKIMSNEVVKQVMQKAQKDVMQGVAFSIPIADSGVFPPMVHHMVKIGEETGNMEEMLDTIAEYYDSEVEMATEALVAAMEPLIIIAMAGIVVPIILAIMLPMLGMQNAIDKAA